MRCGQQGLHVQQENVGESTQRQQRCAEWWSSTGSPGSAATRLTDHTAALPTPGSNIGIRWLYPSVTKHPGVELTSEPQSPSLVKWGREDYRG